MANSRPEFEDVIEGGGDINWVVEGDFDPANQVVRYEGIDYPLWTIYGRLPAGQYYDVSDLDGDGVLDVYVVQNNEILEVRDAATKNDDGTLTPNTMDYDAFMGNDSFLQDVYDKLPDTLKDFITDLGDDPFAVIKRLLDSMPDLADQLKRGMIGVEAVFGDWKNSNIFGPFIIPGVPLPPGIMEVTVQDIQNALEKVGGDLGEFIEVLGKDPEKALKDLLGDLKDWVGGVKDTVLGEGVDSVAGVEEWLKGVLGGVVGGWVITGVYDDVKGWFEDDPPAVPPTPGGVPEDPEPDPDPEPGLEFDGNLSEDPELMGDPVWPGSDDVDPERPIPGSDQEPDPEPPGSVDSNDDLMDPPEWPGQPPSQPDEEQPPEEPGSVPSSGGGGASSGGGGSGQADPFIEDLPFASPSPLEIKQTPYVDYVANIDTNFAELDGVIDRSKNGMLV